MHALSSVPWRHKFFFFLWIMKRKVYLFLKLFQRHPITCYKNFIRSLKLFWFSIVFRIQLFPRTCLRTVPESYRTVPYRTVPYRTRPSRTRPSRTRPSCTRPSRTRPYRTRPTVPYSTVPVTSKSLIRFDF